MIVPVKNFHGEVGDLIRPASSAAVDETEHDLDVIGSTVKLGSR